MERVRIASILAKAETTYATDPVPTGAANNIAVLPDGLSYGPSFTRISRKLMDGSLSRVTGKNVLPRVSLAFRTELRGNRTDGSAADISQGSVAHQIELDPLFQACDMNPVYTAESSGGARDGFVIYTPTQPTSQGPSVTIYFYTGLKLHKVLGCKGTFKISFQAGMIPIVDWSFSGLYVAPTDASIPSLTWLNTVPPLFVNAAATIGAYTPVFEKLDLDLGNTVSERADANSPDGIKGFLVTDRLSKVTIDPESVAVATQDFWGDLYAPVSRTITVPVGTQSGNKFRAVLVSEPEAESYGDRNGNRTHPITYEICRANAADAVNSELQLKFS